MDESAPQTALEAEPNRSDKRGHPLTRLTLSGWILVALASGIVTGVVFGELVAWLGVIGNAFIRLLQMTILPYILASLILGIGGLSYDKARLLAVRAGGILLLTWVIAFVFILALPIGFPRWESASFYSNSLVELPPPPDFLALYIPSNPFHSLAENLIPAVVIFALALGVALIGIKDKEPFLTDLRILCQALMQVAGMVVKLTPIGVFAIAASAAGTMSVAELSKLQVYLILFNLACAILAFWVLPQLVATLTPFTAREVIRVSRTALLTAFTTGNLFVVLPVLTDEAKRLFAERGLTRESTDAYVDVLIPVSFNFPNIGKLIMLVFVLFAGWFSGSEMPLADYPQFVFSGLMSFFGGVDVALPFMLDLMRIPADMYELYVVTGIVNGRTATLLAAMNLLCFTLLVVASLTDALRVDWRRVLLLVAGTAVILAGSLLTARWYFETFVDNAYDADEAVATMHLLREPPPHTLVYDLIPSLTADPDLEAPALDRIRARGELRVGYIPDRMPFAYINDAAQLVGLDVELMHQLARDLEVTPVYMPVEPDAIARLLDAGIIDTALGGVPVTPDGLAHVLYSEPYMDVTAAFLVRDHDRQRFQSLNAIRADASISIAVVRSRINDYFHDALEESFPNAVIDRVESVDTFLSDDGELHAWDAMLVSAERGSAITLLHPEYAVVVPRPANTRVPLSFPVSRNAADLAFFINRWIELIRKGPMYEQAYDHWILGKGVAEDGPRWSVVRDVLGWGR